MRPARPLTRVTNCARVDSSIKRDMAKVLHITNHARAWRNIFQPTPTADQKSPIYHVPGLSVSVCENEK